MGREPRDRSGECDHNYDRPECEAKWRVISHRNFAQSLARATKTHLLDRPTGGPTPMITNILATMLVLDAGLLDDNSPFKNGNAELIVIVVATRPGGLKYA